jgi:hypothetical protein
VNTRVIVTPKLEKPTLVLTANPDTLPIGGGWTTIKWTVKNTEKIIFNGTSLILTEGSMQTGFFNKDSTFTFIARGPGGETTASVTIVVAQPVPPTQNEAYYSAGPWIWVKLEFQDADGFPWRESDIWECMKDDIMTFYFPSKTWVYDNGENRCSYDEPRTYSGNWFITGTVINTGGPNEKITLNPDTLVWVYETIGNVRETFIRPPVYKK